MSRVEAQRLRSVALADCLCEGCKEGGFIALGCNLRFTQNSKSVKDLLCINRVTMRVVRIEGIQEERLRNRIDFLSDAGVILS